MDDQRQRSPGLPKRRGESHAAHVSLEPGGRQGGRDPLERFFRRVRGKRPADPGGVRGQPRLAGKEADQPKLKGVSFCRTKGRRRRTSRILGVSHEAINRWVSDKMQIKPDEKIVAKDEAPRPI
jgi:hypothetical protein